MARLRLSTSPKTTSHRIGWTARVISSTGSWRSLRSSPSRMVSVSDRNRSGPGGSAQPARGAARSSDLTVTTSSCVDRGPRDLPKHVVEGGVRADRGLQLVRAADRADPPAMHDGNPVAQLLRLLHVVSCQ